MNDFTCNGCGEPLVDGGVDWYCANEECNHEWDYCVSLFKEMVEHRERQELKRLKEKYE